MKYVMAIAVGCIVGLAMGATLLATALALAVRTEFVFTAMDAAVLCGGGVALGVGMAGSAVMLRDGMRRCSSADAGRSDSLLATQRHALPVAAAGR